MEPKYCENIIVGVIFKKKFQWYCTEKSIWKLDYRALYADYQNTFRMRGLGLVEFTKQVGSFSEFLSSRFRIPVVDKDTATAFLEQIMLNQISAGELMYESTRAETDEQRKALVPALFVDFDGRRFYSQYPEKDEKFEKYAPSGWESRYADFTRFIPREEQYWLDI